MRLYNAGTRGPPKYPIDGSYCIDGTYCIVSFMRVSLENQVALVVGASSASVAESGGAAGRRGARVMHPRAGKRLRGVQSELARDGVAISIAPQTHPRSRK